MNLLSGLEKYGLDITKGKDLFEEEEQKNVSKQTDEQKALEQHVPAEEEFLLEKRIQCKVCDKTFKTKMVKNGRVKRGESDRDLRPRFLYIDTLKYDVTSCPYCGYTAMNRYFEHISPVQIKLIRENICSKFQPTVLDEKKTYTYEEAVERYKLALLNAIIKKGRSSERAYICLKIAWIMRDMEKTMPAGSDQEREAKEACQKEAEEFYQQAFEGFEKSIAKELYPICGMDQPTLDYLMSCMAFHLGKIEIASKYLASVLTSQSASRRMKDMALDLKDKILAELKIRRS